MPVSQEIPVDRRGKSVADERQYRQIHGMEDHAQGLIAVSLEERNRFFMVKVEPRLAMSRWGDLKPGEARNQLAQGFIKKSQAYRRYLWQEILGEIGTPYLPLTPRARLFREGPAWTAHEVALDV